MPMFAHITLKMFSEGFSYAWLFITSHLFITNSMPGTFPLPF